MCIITCIAQYLVEMIKQTKITSEIIFSYADCKSYSTDILEKHRQYTIVSHP